MSKFWNVQQHDNGNLIYTNGSELVYMEIDSETGKISFYRKFDIDNYKSLLEPEEIEYNDLDNLTGIVDYLMERNEWSDHGYNISIINLLENEIL